MAFFPLVIAFLLQAGSLPPGTYEQSGSFTTSGGQVVTYTSFTVNTNGTITYNLSGGGRFTTPRLRPGDTRN